MSVLPQTVFRRATEPMGLDGGLRLRALEWALYFAVTGTETMAELAKRLRAERAECGEALLRLAQLGLIEERTLDANEYVHALAAAADRDEKSLREFLAGAMRPLPAPAPVPQPEAANAPEPPRPKLREVARPAFGFKPLPLPGQQKENGSMSSASRKLSLRALMNLIERQAGSREAAQLDIYRVFVRVDTLLLKRNGIETLRFAEDRLISDPELEQALVRSVKKTLGLDCPEDMWVEVA